MSVSSRQKVADFLLANVGRVISSRELLTEADGALPYSRRVRELRAEGWPILTHNDRAALKPGEYLLTAPPPDKPLPTFSRSISARLRAMVLDRNGFTCQMCGLQPRSEELNSREARHDLAPFSGQEGRAGGTASRI